MIRGSKNKDLCALVDERGSVGASSGRMRIDKRPVAVQRRSPGRDRTELTKTPVLELRSAPTFIFKNSGIAWD